MLFIISGPSGVGKGTLIQDSISRNSNICLAVSATTRQPRSGEIDGKDYHFLTDEAFDIHIKNDNFLEFCHVHGNRYGTLKTEISDKLSTHDAIIIEIDVQGAQKIRSQPQYPQFHIFISPPSDEILEARLRLRNTENEAVIRHRLKESKRELQQKDDYDKIIINNELTQSLNELNNVILSILAEGVI